MNVSRQRGGSRKGPLPSPSTSNSAEPLSAASAEPVLEGAVPGPSTTAAASEKLRVTEVTPQDEVPKAKRGRRKGYTRQASAKKKGGAAELQPDESKPSLKVDTEAPNVKDPHSKQNRRRSSVARQSKSRTTSQGVPSTLSESPYSTIGAQRNVYFTQRTVDTTAPSEKQLIAERSSITKLFMISDSVASLFTALPDGEAAGKYAEKVDKAGVLPTSSGSSGLSSVSTSSTVVPPTAPSENGTQASSKKTHASITQKEYNEMAKRIRVEEYTTNAICIHVRDMERLVPPQHFLSPVPASVTSDAVTAQAKEASPAVETKKRRASRSRKTRGSANAGLPAVAPAVPLHPALTELERIMRLQKWTQDAQLRAIESQHRHQVPAYYHTLTRVRFNNPLKTDLTVVIGSESEKSVSDVLETIMQDSSSAQQGHGEGEQKSVEEEEDTVNDVDIDKKLMKLLGLSSTEENGSLVISFNPPESKTAETPTEDMLPPTPDMYAIIPLLTIYATCMPRREAALGKCRPLSSTDENIEESEELSTSGSSGSPSSQQSASAGHSTRRSRLTTPRYSTRVTVMLEHDDMDPGDLAALADMHPSRISDRPWGPSARSAAQSSAASLERNAASDVSVAKKSNLTSLYCLIVDGGDF